MITHDWPTEIVNYGNVRKLLKEKPFFAEDIDKMRLGNPATNNLLKVFLLCFVHFFRKLDQGIGLLLICIVFFLPWYHLKQMRKEKSLNPQDFWL